MGCAAITTGLKVTTCVHRTESEFQIQLSFSKVGNMEVADPATSITLLINAMSRTLSKPEYMAKTFAKNSRKVCNCRGIG